ARASLHALADVVAHAVIAAQDERGDQAHEFLRLHGKRAAFHIGQAVQREHALDDAIVLGKDALVHLSAEFAELFETVAHGRLLEARGGQTTTGAMPRKVRRWRHAEITGWCGRVRTGSARPRTCRSCSRCPAWG